MKGRLLTVSSGTGGAVLERQAVERTTPSDSNEMLDCTSTMLAVVMTLHARTHVVSNKCAT
jgi:hypothetical protein